MTIHNDGWIDVLFDIDVIRGMHRCTLVFKTQDEADYVSEKLHESDDDDILFSITKIGKNTIRFVFQTLELYGHFNCHNAGYRNDMQEFISTQENEIFLINAVASSLQSPQSSLQETSFPYATVYGFVQTKRQT